MATVNAIDTVGIFVSGSQGPMVKHTPESAVAAGDCVIKGGIPMMSPLDIAADKLGALSSQGGLWAMKKSAVAFSEGDAMYFDVADNQINKDDANPLWGVCTEDAAATAGVRVTGIHAPLVEGNIES